MELLGIEALRKVVKRNTGGHNEEWERTEGKGNGGSGRRNVGRAVEAGFEIRREVPGDGGC
jgi:hypothetical protein